MRFARGSCQQLLIYHANSVVMACVVGTPARDGRKRCPQTHSLRTDHRWHETPHRQLARRRACTRSSPCVAGYAHTTSFQPEKKSDKVSLLCRTFQARVDVPRHTRLHEPRHKWSKATPGVHPSCTAHSSPACHDERYGRGSTCFL